jgi:hypothetical protein
MRRGLYAPLGGDDQCLPIAAQSDDRDIASMIIQKQQCDGDETQVYVA